MNVFNFFLDMIFIIHKEMSSEGFLCDISVVVKFSYFKDANNKIMATHIKRFGKRIESIVKIRDSFLNPAIVILKDILKIEVEKWIDSFNLTHKMSNFTYLY